RVFLVLLLLYIASTTISYSFTDPGMVTICRDERKYYTRIRSQKCYFGYQRKSSKENNRDRNFMMSWHRRHSTNKHELQNKINDNKVAVSFLLRRRST